MSDAPRHELDQAIDRVAARMVAVPDDASLLSRTMAQLPDRQVMSWFVAWPAQLTAGAALILATFLWARPGDRVMNAPGPVVPAAASPLAAAPVAVVTAPVVVALVPGPGSRIPAGALNREDRGHGLAPIDAIDAIELVGIATPAIELDATSPLEPLVVPELALDTKGES